VEMSDVLSGASERRVTVTFPENGANSDGYTAVTVSFGTQRRNFPAAYFPRSAATGPSTALGNWRSAS
jgi:hypothetical protein